MSIIYLVCGVGIFWYAWWGDRAHLEDVLNYYSAKIGIGGGNMYYPSVIALCVSIYVFYGYFMFRG